MDWLVLLTFGLSLAVSILTGIGGGGGGAVFVPYYIFLGMAPASALATSKFGALGVATGSVAAFKGEGMVNRKLVVPLMIITLVCSIFAAWAIPRLDPELFQKLIGVALVLMTPLMFINKRALKPGPRAHHWMSLGFIVYALISFAQTIVGSGIGIVLVLVLMFAFGLNALEATATKRVAQAVQAVVLAVLLAIQGLVVWSHCVASLIGSTIGTYIGSRIAIKQGAAFVKIALAVTICVSGLILLLS